MERLSTVSCGSVDGKTEQSQSIYRTAVGEGVKGVELHNTGGLLGLVYYRRGFKTDNIERVKLTRQPTHALNKIPFMTSIKLLHVSAPGCHPQEVIQNKEIQA
jgi:hypothetical protein